MDTYVHKGAVDAGTRLIGKTTMYSRPEQGEGVGVRENTSIREERDVANAATRGCAIKCL